MSDLTVACTTCKPAVDQIFDPATGTRQDVVISGDLFFPDQCFVRDEIRFLNGGRLIFAGRPSKENREKLEYLDTYYVICRRLTVIGGFPTGDNPDAGKLLRNNVITWQGRIKSAKAGNNYASAAANGPSFNGAWNDQGQGDDGKNGGNGTNGDKGKEGGHGEHAPKQVVVIALEVDVKPLAHLVIDWDGQDGGDGGRGQNGGKGGAAMNGRIGQSDTTWPGYSCEREPGNGGNGGNGGDGGPGGDAGNGGNAGDIIVISAKEHITTGAFVNGSIDYVNDGGAPGKFGGSGTGGAGAPLGGFAGLPTSECSNASNGQAGVPGSPFPAPPLPVDIDPNHGAPGHQGNPGNSPNLQEIQAGTCADLLPLPMVFDATGLVPNHFCRGFSLPATGDASITGQNFAQASGVTASLAGVTPSIKTLTSTDTQLDLHFQFAGNSGTGACNLVFTRDFGANQTLNNALTLGKFEVLTVTPNNGNKGNAVSVTISGNCFDPTALLQQVLISGLSVNVLNVVVVDEHTVQCVFDIANLAVSGARDVTVKTGLFVHTKIGGFTIN